MNCAKTVVVSDDTPSDLRPEFVSGGGGVELACYLFGSPSSTTIVGVHGIGGGGAVFSELFQSCFGDEVLGVSYDLRGHGRSSKPTEVTAYTSPALWAQDLHSVLARFGSQRNIVLGWSLGAMVVADYLERYGDEIISGVVLIGPALSLGNQRAGRWSGGAFRRAMAMYLRTEVLSDEDATFFAMAILGHDASPDHLATIGELARRVPLGVRRAIFSQSRDVHHVYRNTDVPVLIIHGANDEVILPQSSIEAVEETNALLKVLPKGGHAPFWDLEEDFHRWLIRFVELVQDDRSMALW